MKGPARTVVHIGGGLVSGLAVYLGGEWVMSLLVSFRYPPSWFLGATVASAVLVAAAGMLRSREWRLWGRAAMVASTLLWGATWFTGWTGHGGSGYPEASRMFTWLLSVADAAEADGGAEGAREGIDEMMAVTRGVFGEPELTVTAAGWSVTLVSPETGRVCSVYMGEPGVGPAVRQGYPACQLPADWFRLALWLGLFGVGALASAFVGGTVLRTREAGPETDPGSGSPDPTGRPHRDASGDPGAHTRSTPNRPSDPVHIETLHAHAARLAPAYQGGSSERYYRMLSRTLIARHGPLVRVEYQSHFPTFEIWFTYEDDTRLYSGERTGKYDLHFLRFGYFGEGPRNAQAFLGAAGFDLTGDQIDTIAPGDAVELENGRAVIVRGADDDAAVTGEKPPAAALIEELRRASYDQVDSVKRRIKDRADVLNPLLLEVALDSKQAVAFRQRVIRFLIVDSQYEPAFEALAEAYLNDKDPDELSRTDHGAFGLWREVKADLEEIGYTLG